MVECQLTDLADIAGFIGKWESNCMVRVRCALVDPCSHIMSHRDKSIYFLLEAKSPRVAVIHMYCARQSRGRKMVQFIDEVREWVKLNTEFEFIFNYTTDFKAKLIMAHVGSKSIGTYKGHTVFKQTIKR